MRDTTAQALLRCLEGLGDEMVDVLERLVRAESPTHDHAAQAQALAVLREQLEGAGLRTRRVRAFGSGDHLLALPRTRRRGAPRQLVLGHVDTVWPAGTLATMPFERRDGRVYGPGTADMKGGLVMIAFALRALRDAGLEPQVTPVVLVNADEEIGSPDARRHHRRLAAGAVRAFVLECGEGAGGALKIARKGLGRFTVTVHGRSAHAGVAPEEGVSAILELAHQVQQLFALNDPAHGVTVNVGTIDGGFGPNVVADRATAVVDVRVPTLAAAEQLETRIRGLTPVLAGARVEVDGGLRRLPMEPTERNRGLLAAAVRLGAEVGLELEDAGVIGGGSDANTTSGLTATLDGLGPTGGGSHAPDEHVDLSTLARRTALLALLLLEPP
jgi:glutamate carboxypeptidase